MIITNIHMTDKVINGRVHIVKQIETKENELSTIYFSLYDTFADSTRINGKDVTAQNNRWVLTDKEWKSIYLIYTLIYTP